jgi:hypothetical protein
MTSTEGTTGRAADNFGSDTTARRTTTETTTSFKTTEFFAYLAAGSREPYTDNR